MPGIGDNGRMPASHPAPNSETPLWLVPVTYGAVGGTQTADLLRYPPKGYRPIERRVRLGHGAERFEHAWMQTLTWGIQRRSGFRVRVIDAPPEVTDASYTPVSFEPDGTPIEPATLAADGEQVFSPEGEPLLRSGDTALLRLLLWPVDVPCRVVYVVDEPARKGFAYGTLPGHPARGEESFIVEHRPDDSVWLTIRAFSRPSGWLYWLGYPISRLTQAIITRRYERALTGPIADAR